MTLETQIKQMIIDGDEKVKKELKEYIKEQAKTKKVKTISPLE